MTVGSSHKLYMYIYNNHLTVGSITNNCYITLSVVINYFSTQEATHAGI